MIIFILTLVFMVTVIPYAFHVVIQQLKDQFGEEEKGKKSQKLENQRLRFFFISDCNDEQ